MPAMLKPIKCKTAIQQGIRKKKQRSSTARYVGKAFSSIFLCDLWEVRHWNETQCKPIMFQNFWQLICPGTKSRKSAERRWERFKVKVEFNSIPHSKFLMMRQDLSIPARDNVGIVIDARKDEIDDIYHCKTVPDYTHPENLSRWVDPITANRKLADASIFKTNYQFRAGRKLHLLSAYTTRGQYRRSGTYTSSKASPDAVYRNR